MLYGANRNKNGKEISDYEKYKPWEAQEYSGKLAYKLDNGNYYEIYRNFSSKNPKLYNENLEDITANYSIDKTRGSEFFKQQVGIEEELLFSTNVIMQNETKLEKQSQNLLIQKMANIISSGEENTSYKTAYNKLAKKLLEEVGTERSTQKPLNIVTEEIHKLENEKKNLQENKNKKNELEKEIEQILNNIKTKELDIELIKEIKILKQKENVEEEKIKTNENNLAQLFAKKDELLLNENNNEKIKNKKINLMFYIIYLVIFLLTATSFLINLNFLLKIIFLGINLTYLIFLIIKNIKNKKINNKIIEEKNNLEKENNILDNLINEKEKEINNLKNEKSEKINIEKINIKNKYNTSEKIIEDYFYCNLDEIENIINYKENELKKQNFNLQELQLESKAILTKLNNLALTEESLHNLNNKKEELLQLSTSIQLAEQILEEAYKEMQEKVSPQYMQNLGKIAETITQGKYKKVVFNNQSGLLIEKENGEYVNAELLSKGTIDQMYLSLRLSIATSIAKESLPIILDETFAYYDNERLKSTLKYLAENYNKNQIIILTCSKREKNALNELNIEYNEIVL